VAARADGGVDGGRKRPDLGPSLWLGACLGCVVGFAVSALRLVWINRDAGILGAAAFGAAAYFTLDRYWSLRQAELRRGPRRPGLQGRAKEIALAPSFEVYDPRRAESAEAEVPPPSDE